MKTLINNTILKYRAQLLRHIQLNVVARICRLFLMFYIKFPLVLVILSILFLK